MFVLKMKYFANENQTKNFSPCTYNKTDIVMKNMYWYIFNKTQSNYYFLHKSGKILKILLFVFFTVKTHYFAMETCRLMFKVFSHVPILFLFNATTDVIRSRLFGNFLFLSTSHNFVIVICIGIV